MSVKNLKPAAIVPDSIYVERAADRQLRSIINDMGRPGYVLVARQMGKTNLLLHMKRERVNDIVLYTDLSSRFDNPRIWFRNIIDMLIEAHGQKFPVVSEKILEQRKDAQFEANVEYDRHLRMILREVNCKVIIILDEIDSLVNTSYSDVILSQIRSMYFSRANYPEYEKLTYVLSGVVEPTDLIKDKNISPFNIGEKIYLENFDFREFHKFLDNAGLLLDDDVATRVFDWTNGNPRITWDICAEIENIIQNVGFVSVEDVDNVVAKTYLHEYDRAPVDHIRTLVKSDPKIRDAIDEIRYGKGAVLDQGIKNRLYLAGIIGSAGGDVTISNKVIDASLSDAWLKSLLVPNPTAFADANKYFIDKDYQSVVAEFKKVLGTRTGVQLSTQDRKRLALSYLYLGHVSEAVRELKLCLAQESDPSSVQHLNFELGIALAADKRFTEAQSAFARVSSGPDNFVTYKAMLEQTFVALMIGDGQSLNSGKKLCTDIISELSSQESQTEPKQNEIIILAYYLRSQLFSKLNNEEEAGKDLGHALSLATARYKPGLLLAKADMSKRRNIRVGIAREIVSLIVQERLLFSFEDESHLQLSRARIADVFILLIRENLVKEFDELAKYCLSISAESSSNEFAMLKSLYDDSLSIATSNDSIGILVWAIRYFEGVEKDWRQKIEVYREVVMVYGGNEKSDLRTRYLRELNVHESEKESFFDSSHTEALMTIGTACVQSSDWRLGRQLFDVWQKYRSSADLSGIYALLMDYYELLGAKAEQLFTSSVLEIAQRILRTMKEYESSFKNIPESDTALLIRREAESMAKSWTKNDSLEKDPLRDIGRNTWVIVQYPGMSAVNKKFKHVEDDLRKGNCRLYGIAEKNK